MAIERTIPIIEPDAIEKNVISKIYSRFEEDDLRIIAAKMRQLPERGAEGFYAIHKGRPFYEDLVKFITCNPAMIQVSEGENAVAKNHELMGATSPADAAPGTIHVDFAESVSANVAHGSNSVENAAIEIAYSFSQNEVYPRQKQKACSRYTAVRLHIGRQNCFVHTTSDKPPETPKGSQSRADR